MKVWVDDHETPKPEDAFFYELAANGLFIHKRMPFWDAVVPVEKISSLEPKDPQLELKLPAIPEELVQSVVRFFAWIFKKQHTEVAALIWYNGNDKKYLITIPKQTVGSASISYDTRDEFKEPRIEGYCLVGTFHSHCSMSAFHSCVDKKDEESFDGIHFTFGDFSDSKDAMDISISAQAAINGTRFKLDPTDYLAGIESLNKATKDPFTNSDKKNQFIKKWGFISEFQRGSNRFKLVSNERILPENYEPNKDWDDKVKKQEWASSYYSWSSRGNVGFATKPESPSVTSVSDFLSESAWGDDLVTLDSHPDKVRLDKGDRSDKFKKKKDKKDKSKKNKGEDDKD